MEDFVAALKQQGFTGDIDSSDAARKLYSHDASMFEIVPELIVAPKNAQDVEIVVKLAAERKKADSKLSLTARSAGTDMSGAAINDSIIVDFNRYLTKIEAVSERAARAQPGVFYRDFEKQTLKHKALLPPYPASR